jgi:hypothetical protein
MLDGKLRTSLSHREVQNWHITLVPYTCTYALSCIDDVALDTCLVCGTRMQNCRLAMTIIHHTPLSVTSTNRSITARVLNNVLIMLAVFQEAPNFPGLASDKYASPLPTTFLTSSEMA